MAAGAAWFCVGSGLLGRAARPIRRRLRGSRWGGGGLPRGRAFARPGSHPWDSNPRPHPYQGCALPTELGWRMGEQPRRGRARRPFSGVDRAGLTAGGSERRERRKRPRGRQVARASPRRPFPPTARVRRGFPAGGGSLRVSRPTDPLASPDPALVGSRGGAEATTEASGRVATAPASGAGPPSSAAGPRPAYSTAPPDRAETGTVPHGCVANRPADGHPPIPENQGCSHSPEGSAKKS